MLYQYSDHNKPVGQLRTILMDKGKANTVAGDTPHKAGASRHQRPTRFCQRHLDRLDVSRVLNCLEFHPQTNTVNKSIFTFTFISHIIKGPAKFCIKLICENCLLHQVGSVPNGHYCDDMLGEVAPSYTRAENCSNSNIQSPLMHQQCKFIAS